MNTFSNDGEAARLLANCIITARQLMIVFSVKDVSGNDHVKALQSVKHALRLLEQIKSTDECPEESSATEIAYSV